MLLPYMYRYTCYTIPEYLYGIRVRPDSHSRRALTQEEEEQKYKDFEDLIDEIRGICKIKNIWKRRKITCWKLKRRYRIARKYKKSADAVKAKAMLFLYGRSKVHAAIIWPIKQIWKKRSGDHANEKTV